MNGDVEGDRRCNNDVSCEEDEFKKRKDATEENISADLEKIDNDTKAAEPLLTGTAASQLDVQDADSEELKVLEHHTHVKKIRECLSMLHSDKVFGLYYGFLKKKKLFFKQI